MKPSPLIALEGIDGTGKGTQAQLLVEALERKGVKVSLFSFPSYGKTLAGKLVGQYLNGELGDARHVDSRLSAVLYAVDRFERKQEIERALQQGRLVLCDRYTGSNLAHQVARSPAKGRPALRKLILQLEHEVLGLPRPKLVVFLDMPEALAQQRVKLKARRSYTRDELDAHEADKDHLKGALREYRRQAREDKSWVRIATVTRSGEPRSREEIHADVVQAVARVVPALM